MKKWLSDFGLGLLLGIAITFMLAWLTYTIIILKKDPALANAYVAVGTLILAIVTALLVGFTWLNIRNTTEKERRDSEERLLNEIIEWAEKSAESAIYRQKTNPHELWNAKLNYKNCRAVSEYIKEIAASSFSTLSSHIDDVATKLDDAIDGTTQYIESKLTEKHDRMLICEERLTNAVKELFKEAAKTKTRDMG